MEIMKFYSPTLLLKQVLFLYLMLFSAMGFATTYTFTGSGDWAISGNWSGGAIPPITLPSGDSVIINGTGACIFDEPYGPDNQFYMYGTLVINASKTLTMTYGKIYLNLGILTVLGTLDIDDYEGVYYNNGTVNVSGTVNVGTSNGLYSNNLSGTVNILAGGAINAINGGSVFFKGSVSVEAGGTLSTSSGGQVTLYQCTLTNNDTLTNAAGCTFYRQSSSATINNLGTFTNNGTISGSTTGTFITGTGTINGSGSIGMRHTNSASATLSPGNSVGCMTIDGDFVNEGILEIELADGVACTNFDQVQVINGNAATVGGTINITFPGNLPYTRTFAIVTATGTKTDNSPTITWPAGISGSGSFVGNEYQVSFALLPVELVDFSGKLQQNNQVHLNWSTASEKNNDYFEIQRSNDASHWAEIGRIAGNGSSLEMHAYSFIDGLPQPGTNYYRLKQVDFDGRHEFSEVVSVELNEGSGNIQFWPNPSPGVARLYVDADALGAAKFSLYNSTGTLVEETVLTLDGEHLNFDFDFTNIPFGIYVAVLSTDSQYWTQRLAVY